MAGIAEAVGRPSGELTFVTMERVSGVSLESRGRQNYFYRIT